jgi:hypothetical protein
MPIVIGAKRESDFTDPIGMLGDCHRRIDRFLNVLVRVAAERPLFLNIDDDLSFAQCLGEAARFRGATAGFLPRRDHAWIWGRVSGEPMPGG